MRIKKYPKIKRVGDPETKDLTLPGEIVMTEKYDGNNFRFTIDEEEGLVFGTRNTVITEEPDDMFKQVVDHITDKVDPEDVSEVCGGTNYTFFGENMVRHTLDYDWEEIPQFLGFDIYDNDNDKFIPWHKARRWFETLGLEVVREISCIDPDEFTEDNLQVPSSNYREGKAEGIVLKNYNSQTFAKLRTEEFKEKNQDAFGRSKKHSTTDNERFVSTYCTNSRIEKTIYKLRDEGHDIEMPLMKHLPIRVYEDVWEEEMEEIIRKHWELDLNQIRSLISHRCSSVLKMVIQQQMFDGGE